MMPSPCRKSVRRQLQQQTSASGTKERSKKAGVTSILEGNEEVNKTPIRLDF
jgi:hypothetical protein